MWTRNSKSRLIINFIICGLLALLSSPPLAAASATAPSAILGQYRDQRITWFAAVWPYANTLFGMLAVIEFAWSAAVMLLEKPDLQSWTAALVRKVMWLGAFYALLINGRFWIPAITDSFEMIGQNAAATGPMAPSDVFSRGIDLAGALMSSANASGFFTHLGTSLTMVITGIITALAFIAITVQFVVAMVESYIIVAAAFIFLGFGGSRWTAPYVERYIGLGVSNGVKIMLLYLLIGTGMNLSVGWMTEAENIVADSSPAAMSALEIMGASIIFMMLCWQIPKLFAAVLGGSPALSGGDLVGTTGFLAGGAVAVGSMAATGVGAVASGARSLVLAAGSTGVGGASGSSAGAGSTLKPPANPPSSDTSGNSVSPPSTASAPRSNSTKPDVRRHLTTHPPSDSGPHASPPRMNLDDHE